MGHFIILYLATIVERYKRVSELISNYVHFWSLREMKRSFFNHYYYLNLYVQKGRGKANKLTCVMKSNKRDNNQSNVPQKFASRKEQIFFSSLFSQAALSLKWTK